MAEQLLKSKNVLLTGASRGIGSAIAELYAKHGARLYIVARNEEKLSGVAEKCKELGSPDVTIIQADLLNSDDLVRVAAEVGGNLDILVNNAGMAATGGILQGNPDEWEKIVMLNLVTPMKLTGLFAPALTSNKGYIINISSVAGLHAIKGQAPYCASKWGMTGWSLTCLEDLKEHGVGVTAIFPAYVESDMTAKASFPSDQMIRPEDIAQAALLPFRMSRYAVPSEIVVRNAVRPQ